MGDEEAEAWLRVALRVVEEYPVPLLRAATKHACRTCTHHAQIVPTIVEFCDKHRPAVIRDPWGGIEALPPPRKPVPALTQDMVDRMTPEFVRMGLTTGAIVLDADGKAVVNPDV